MALFFITQHFVLCSIFGHTFLLLWLPSIMHEENAEKKRDDAPTPTDA